MTHAITDPEVLLIRLQENDSVSLLPASYMIHDGLREKGIVCREIDGELPEWEFALAWRKDDPRMEGEGTIVGKAKTGLFSIASRLEP